MKRTLSLIIVFLLSVMLSACREGNGDVSSYTNTQSNESVLSNPSSSFENVSSEPNEQNPSKPSSEVPTISDSVLESLDTKKFGWGPGRAANHARPTYPINNQNQYGKYDADFILKDEKIIYLTFDEGYENGYTARILDVLKDKNVKAVFFVTLPYAKQNKSLITRMIDEGHIVGNHSVNHLSFPSLNLQKAKSEIMELHDYIKENFNYEMTLFRFPMGEFSEQMLALVQSCGYRSVFWSFAYADWNTSNQPDNTDAYNLITENSHNGAIFLLHAVSKTNTEVLGDVIDKFREQGYSINEYGK